MDSSKPMPRAAHIKREDVSLTRTSTLLDSLHHHATIVNRYYSIFNRKQDAIESCNSTSIMASWDDVPNDNEGIWLVSFNLFKGHLGIILLIASNLSKQIEKI